MNLALDVLPCGLVIQNVDGVVTDCNATAAELLELTADQLTGLASVDPRWHAVDADGRYLPGEHNPAMVALRTGQPIRGFVMGVQGTRGVRRWLSVNATPTYDDVGRVASVVTAFTDISEPRRELDLQRAVATLSGVVTWSLELPRGRLTDNGSWEPLGDQWLFRVAGGLEVAGGLLERIDPADLGRVRAALQALITGETSVYRCEWRQARVDGTWARIHDVAVVLERDGDGRASRIGGTRRRLGGADHDDSPAARDEPPDGDVREAYADGLWEWHVGTDYRWHSTRCWSLLGFPLEADVPSNSLSSLDGRIYPDDVDLTQTKVRECLSTGLGYDVQHRLQLADGTYRWFHTRATTRLEGDKVIRIIGSIRDIHEQKLAELERNRLFTHSLDLLCVAGFDGYFKQINPAWERTLGWAEAELLAVPYLDLIHPEDVDSTRRAAAGIADGQTVIDFENRYRCKDGSHRWLSWRALPEPSSQTIFAVVRDVTEAKEQAVALASKTAMLEEAQTVARIGSWAYDLGSGEVTWSKETYRLFGREEAAGVPSVEELARLYDDVSTGLLARCVERAWAEGVPYHVVLRTLDQVPGVKYLRAEGHVIKGVDGRPTGMVGTVMDVTTDVERENALREARTLADAASLAKSEFLANMSHEIRTPLTAILGNADLIRESLTPSELNPSVAENLDTIERSGRQLLSIISDVLDVSKVEAGHMTIERVPVNPVRLMNDAVAALRGRASAKGVLLTHRTLGPVPEQVLADPVRMRQIIDNLVSNAIKFTHSGFVEVRLSALTNPSGGLQFEVEDTGIGLTDHERTRLFQAFTQADASTTRRYGGSGLGLLISRSLARLLGGDITVESTLGQGSVFRATLLAAECLAAECQSETSSGSVAVHPVVSPAPAEKARPLAGLRILLAEDGPDNRQLITLFLSRAGATVEAVENGRWAVERLCDGRFAGPLAATPAFDLFITDIQMPELDGHATTRLLRERGCLLPILALTADALAGTRAACLAAGADAYATKPIDRKALIAACLNLVGLGVRAEGAEVDHG